MKLPVSSKRIGLPLALQMIVILVCALVAAQLVTLMLTMLLPPRPTARWDMAEVVRALGRGEVPSSLERKSMAGPPDISAQGWLVSESSREALAQQLSLDRNDVVLAFYTQLPVGGVAVPTNTHSPLAVMKERHFPSVTSLLVETAQAQSIPGGPPPGGSAGPGGMPGGGFPGGMPPGGPRGPGGMPGGMSGNMPGGTRMPGQRPGNALPGGGRPGGPLTSTPGTGAGTPPNTGAGGSTPSTPSTADGYSALPGSQLGNAGGQSQAGGGAWTGGGAPLGGMLEAGPQGAIVGQGINGPLGLPRTNDMRIQPPVLVAPESAGARASSPARPRAVASALPTPTTLHPDTLATPLSVPQSPTRATIEPEVETGEAMTASAHGNAQPIPFRRERNSLFDMASPPFIEGDFVAAARQPDGQWLAVAPREEPFPNAWQQRVMLWFALSLAIISPLAWLFARRIVVPLRDFARAAEQLGRDPSATILPLSGPAEIGRAANAFNQMRNRLRAFVDDRTAMVGAISHDLRTPLTRLRFRIEDVPDEQRDGLLKEVTEMEAMISQVITFIRDASTPGARQRVDFAELVEGSVADARLVGADVVIDRNAHIPVDVDPVGIRRLLGNLLENAVKYGESPHVRVSLRDGEAIAEIVDKGPGIPEEEFDRVFEPFYRSDSARKSGKKGSGLGLAVCRSIARAHGGDVTFEHTSDGFIARVKVPAAFVTKPNKAA
ncbi:HAMP domain-containing protein [Novosphingobium profundi]|uniref:ATP-binding protein n=1 Tax=Novosphingobium profundi TaxID=1774954 RepID=UPI001BDB229B|nr:ATP-binding protein [Novosphingobium profundi]MBT0668392.1 HAMP domain-containing protein [Novosphingobium profundi]